MEDKRRRRTLLQLLFALVLVLSLVVLFFSLPRLPGPGMAIPDYPPGEAADLLVAAASLLTAVTSLAGLVWTTFAGWRKDQREAEAAELERERRELEIEKLRRELEGLDSDQGDSDSST